MKSARRIAVLLVVIVAAATAYYFLAIDRFNGLELIGIVDANQVIVSAKITGRIEKLFVDEGQQVKAGDLIAQLDTPELAAEVQAADANVTSLGHRVAESQASEELARGQTSSDVLNYQAQLQSARAALAQAQADLVRIELDAKRTDTLAMQGVASQQDRDDADANLKAQQARVRAAQDQVNAAQAALEMAKARTHQAHAAQSDVAATRAQHLQARAQSEQASARLAYTSIYAPVSGTVSIRVARQGEVVNPGDPIVTLVDFSDTWVRAPLPETYADRVGVGDELTVLLPGGGKVQGKVIVKAAEADFATQRDVSRRKRDIKTISLKLSVPNPDRRLVPGMTATVLVPQAKLKG